MVICLNCRHILKFHDGNRDAILPHPCLPEKYGTSHVKKCDQRNDFHHRQCDYQPQASNNDIQYPLPIPGIKRIPHFHASPPSIQNIPLCCHHSRLCENCLSVLSQPSSPSAFSYHCSDFRHQSISSLLIARRCAHFLPDIARSEYPSTSFDGPDTIGQCCRSHQQNL